MKAVNLYFLTRTHEPAGLSGLLRELSGRLNQKAVSIHEAATLWTLADRILEYLMPVSDEWILLLDGFFFSYVIEHIGKEFDLLKLSSDSRTVLNIELKSEKVEKEKILKQLEQNRYYLSHVAETIDSYTYVMQTNELYTLDERGELRLCAMEELIRVLMKEEMKDYLHEGIEDCFSAAEYLISPVADPEKFLERKYFLTNQQFDFRRRILNVLKGTPGSGGANPVISISGIAGTGKTLLLLDLAVELSSLDRVLFIHSGPLRKGHIDLDRQLKQVDIVSSEAMTSVNLAGYGYVIIDEADHLDTDTASRVLEDGRVYQIPVILAYDPHSLLHSNRELSAAGFMEHSDAVQMIEQQCTLSLSFTGNIRINRPVYSFLRSLLNLKDHNDNIDYSCIDILYADNLKESSYIEGYYREKGYVLVSMSGGDEGKDGIITREYDKVIMVLDRNYFYDGAMHLRAYENEEDALRLLYEGLSRTRGSLCLLINRNRDLFGKIIGIRNGQILSDQEGRYVEVDQLSAAGL